MAAGLCLSVVVCRLLQQQRAFKAIELGRVSTVSGDVHARQRCCEPLEACRCLSYGPVCLGQERQQIQPPSFYACSIQGHQALAELLDPLLGLSLLRQHPACSIEPSALKNGPWAAPTPAATSQAATA